MAKARKRRVSKTRPHQSVKTAESASRNNINWGRIFIITIGIIITLSMILSLIRPGS